MKTFKISNATEIWQKETSLPSVASFSQSLDNILGTNGFQLGSITELLGLPGSGKTQLCLQLCASVQIPKELGGLNAEALFIDTNTNFTISRFRGRCQSILGEPLQLTEDEALSKLHYVNAFGLEKFCAFMYRLPNFLGAHPNVVLSNEMSTRVGLSTGAVVGSLGDAWAHRCNVRVLLSTPQIPQDPTERLALLLKSNVAPSTVARFKLLV
ncbi:hypothetical protein HF086_002985 [Spodoptera exigua]|uniref:DNA repair protein RAD51 homolog 3 n=1 Tax=Spodoptera exigua TaxID=7107 RepID=A0A922MSD2_SPOEX|nr:hypothetical protein HF086_002985 [Spodoptera exigua]